MVEAGVAPLAREVLREARRILPILERTGGEARCVPPRKFGGRPRIEIRGGRGRPPRLERTLFDAFIANGWMEERASGIWRLSPAGSAWARQCGEAGQGGQVTALQAVEVPEGGIRTMRVNAAESPLAWLKGRATQDGAPFLSDDEFASGERLRRDYTAAMLMPSVTANWDGFHLPRMPRRGRGPVAAIAGEGALAARRRVEAALASVGPDLSGLLVDVCCHLVGLEDAERTRAWPQRSAKVVLRIALGHLARHYGLVREPADNGRPARRHVWTREGYRPTLDGGTEME